MQPTKNNKMTKSDSEKMKKKHKSAITKTQTIIIITTTAIFITILLLQLWIIIRYNYSGFSNLSKINNKTSTANTIPEITYIFKRDDLKKLIIVSYNKNSSNVKSKICIGAQSNQRISNCSEITLTKQDEHVFLPPKAEILGNKKLVLTLVWKKITPGEDISDVSVTFYILDLKDQHIKPIEIQVPVDIGTLRTYNSFEIIPYDHDFDVFIKSSQHCSPAGSICLIRYSDQGKRLKTTNFNFPTKNNAFNSERLVPLKKFDSTSGYVYISLKHFTVKFLNQYLEAIKEKAFTNSISSHSVLNGSIGICTIVIPYTECFKLNSRLEIEEKYLLKNHIDRYDWKLFNLMNGDSLVISISKSLNSNLTAELRQLSSEGRISKPEIIDLPDCDSKTDPFEQFDELTGNYCFSFTCQGRSVTYCLDTSKAYDLNSYEIQY